MQIHRATLVDGDAICKKTLPKLRHRKTVATAGRSYGGPLRTLWGGGFGGNFQKMPLTSQKVAFIWRSPDASHFGAAS